MVKNGVKTPKHPKSGSEHIVLITEAKLVQADRNVIVNDRRGTAKLVQAEKGT